MKKNSVYKKSLLNSYSEEMLDYIDYCRISKRIWYENIKEESIFANNDYLMQGEIKIEYYDFNKDEYKTVMEYDYSILFGYLHSDFESAKYERASAMINDTLGLGAVPTMMIENIKYDKNFKISEIFYAFMKSIIYITKDINDIDKIFHETTAYAIFDDEISNQIYSLWKTVKKNIRSIDETFYKNISKLILDKYYGILCFARSENIEQEYKKIKEL